MSKIVMGTVNSASIKAIGFSGGKGEKGTLRIQFSDGKTVNYTDVAYSLYKRLVFSHSPGKFYNEEIRGRFMPPKR